MDINLGYLSGNDVALGYSGAYTGGTSYPYTFPEGLVDTKSLVSGIKLPSGTTFRFTQDPSVGVIDKTAGQAQTPPWSSDINDIYQPPGAYTGTVTIGLEAKEADGTLSAWVVTMTVVNGVVVDVSRRIGFIRPAKRKLIGSIKESIRS